MRTRTFALTSAIAIVVASWAMADSNVDPDKQPAWISVMREVHARYTGKPGVFAQFGDSITDSRAFWSGLPYSRKNASREMEAAFQLVNTYMLKDCWDRKGRPSRSTSFPAELCTTRGDSTRRCRIGLRRIGRRWPRSGPWPRGLRPRMPAVEWGGRCCRST